MNLKVSDELQFFKGSPDKIMYDGHSLFDLDNLVVPLCRTATAQRSFSYRAITAWNSLIIEETKNSATLSF